MKNIKIKNTVTVFAMVSLLLLITGISFAAYNYISNASDNNITAGQITMSYTEPSNTVVLKDALPKPDDLGMVQDEYFEFSVMSNAKTNENDDRGVEIPYEVSIEKISLDPSLKELKDSQVKIYLTKLEGENETEVLGPTLISDLDKSAYKDDSLAIYDRTNTHKNNNGPITTKFRLRFWIDNLVDVSNWATTNEYEYKFKVNVNANSEYLDVENMNTLSSKIKNAYTVENGTAVEENGYYYLQGPEIAAGDPSTKLMEMFGNVGSVYLYRQEVNAVNVQPTSNIKKMTDTKQYTFNQVLLENDIKNFFINSGEATLEEYETMTGPFGGYVNAIIGMVSGVVTEDMEYAEDKTIDDIPSIDEVMAAEDMKVMFIEYISEFVSYAINKDSFMLMYSKGDAIDVEFLNANLEAGALLLGEEEMVNLINANFGSVSNYAIAEINGLVDYDTMGLIEGKTIDDIPTLESVFLKDGPVLLTNTYVKLNDILWKVMGVNEDDTIKLISTYRVRINGEGPLVDGNVGKFLGYNDYKNSPFMALIKGTTLEDIIVKSEFKYDDEGVEGKVLSYAGMPSYEDLAKSINDGYSYLIDINISFNNMSVSTTTMQQVMNNKIKNYKYFYNDTNDDNLTKEGEISRVDLYPVITVKNIEVIGEGTKNNPYMLEDEKVQTEAGFAKALAYSNLYVDVDGNNDTYGKLGLYQNVFTSYNVSSTKSGTVSFIDSAYSTGLSVNNKCYYETIDGISKVIEYSGNCRDKFVSITTQPDTTIDTYSFNETTMSVVATNVTSYQWQQKIGDEWVDLEDLTGRISGTKTDTLTIIPTSDFSSVNYFRCIIKNELSKVSSSEVTMNLVLTDGEWVYEEIEDTNKFQMISYIGNPADSTYFTLLDDGASYHLDFPSAINGDSITNIVSLSNNTEIATSTWDSKIIKSLEIPGSIKSLSSTFLYSPLTNLILNEGLEEILSLAFYKAKLTELVIPDSVVSIGSEAFSGSPLTKLKLSKNLQNIAQYAFQEALLTELEIPSGVKGIGGAAFQSSPLTKLVLNEGLVTISTGAFGDAVLTSLELPSTVETIGSGAFSSSPLTELIIPNKVTTIGENAFFNAKLTELKIPSSVKAIGWSAFEKSPLKKLTLYEGLEKIYGEAFYNAQLTELSVPSSVTKVGRSAFGWSLFTNLKIYGKTSLDDFAELDSYAFRMADGYEPQFIPGILG